MLDEFIRILAVGDADHPDVHAGLTEQADGPLGPLLPGGIRIEYQDHLFGVTAISRRAPP